MTDLTTVPTAADRKIACDAAVAEQAQQAFLAAEANAQQANIQPLFKSAIFEWCSETAIDSRYAAQSEKSWPVNGGDFAITSTVLDTWQAELEAKGYTIVRSGNNFTVKLVA